MAAPLPRFTECEDHAQAGDRRGAQDGGRPIAGAIVHHDDLFVDRHRRYAL